MESQFLEFQLLECQLLELQLLEHQSARWLDRESLHDVPWLPADIALLDKLSKIVRPMTREQYSQQTRKLSMWHVGKAPSSK